MVSRFQIPPVYPTDHLLGLRTVEGITAPEQDRQNATMRKGSPIPRWTRGFEDEGFCVVEEMAV
jgi:hypothetical protein